jgi:DNA-binding ferritin-like protein (Dps family)
MSAAPLPAASTLSRLRRPKGHVTAAAQVRDAMFAMGGTNAERTETIKAILRLLADSEAEGSQVAHLRGSGYIVAHRLRALAQAANARKGTSLNVR